MTTEKITSHSGWSPDGTHVHGYTRPKLKPNSTHYEGCSSDEDPDGETMCVCASIEAEPVPDPREDDDEDGARDCGGYSPDTWCGICEACEEEIADHRELYGNG